MSSSAPPVTVLVTALLWMSGCTSVEFPLFILEHSPAATPDWEEIDIEDFAETYPDAAGVYLFRHMVVDSRLMRWANGSDLRGIRMTATRHLVLDPLDNDAAPFAFGVRKREELIRCWIVIHYPDGRRLTYDIDDLKRMTRLRDGRATYYLDAPDLDTGCIVDIGTEIHDQKVGGGRIYLPSIHAAMPTERLVIESYLSNRYRFNRLDELDELYPGGVTEYYDAERKRHVMRYVATDLPAGSDEES